MTNDSIKIDSMSVENFYKQKVNINAPNELFKNFNHIPIAVPKNEDASESVARESLPLPTHIYKDPSKNKYTSVVSGLPQAHHVKNDSTVTVGASKSIARGTSSEKLIEQRKKEEINYYLASLNKKVIIYNGTIIIFALLLAIPTFLISLVIGLIISGSITYNHLGQRKELIMKKFYLNEEEAEERIKSFDKMQPDELKKYLHNK